MGDKKPKDVEVYALVGPAGTGKSQRAQSVAAMLGAELLIDDGLLIKKGQIVSGRSAKTERNQVRAIRRALFQFPEHRHEVRASLKENGIFRLLIVATSEEMARRIARRLDLPAPKRIVLINEVATPEEIEKALRERRLKRQHVIPVSFVQVRKNFAGKLVGKLRIFWNRGESHGEKTIVRPPYSFIGEMTIEPAAIAGIVQEVAQRSQQVDSVREVKVGDEDEKLHITVRVAITIGELSFLQLAQLLQKRLASSVAYFTGLEVGQVDVIVNEVRL